MIDIQKTYKLETSPTDQHPYQNHNNLLNSLHINSEFGIAAAIEAKRLADKHGKDFLTCDDLVKITGFGTNNIRQLMCSDEFPYIQVGNRKAVSVIAFTLWSLKNNQNNLCA